MATILSTLRVYNAFYLVVDTDPSVAPGAPAGVGSLAVTTGGGLYEKTGPNDVDWIVRVTAGAVGPDVTFGATATGGTIVATGGGELAFGSADTTGNITASDYGAIASGYATDNGVIEASEWGAQAHGYALNAGSIIRSRDYGCLAQGSAQNGGELDANTYGAIAAGFASDAGSRIRGNNAGTLAHGFVSGAAKIDAVANGTHAFGIGLDQGEILAGGQGSFAAGYVDGVGSLISSAGNGSLAFGFAQGGSLTSAGLGSMLGGSAGGTEGNSVASGRGSFGWGAGHNISAAYGIALGVGHVISSYAATVVGAFAALPVSSPLAPVATDYAFVVGNGTGVGTESNAWRLDKDGKIQETGALRVPARVITGDTTLSARTDRKIVLNDVTAGTWSINLPPGEQGLTYEFGKTILNTGVFLPVPNGLDNLDAAITQQFNDLSQSSPLYVANVSITFISGTWYSV